MLNDRESELAALSGAVRAAARRRGSVVVVRGPFGAGRTTLLHAFAREAAEQGAQVLRASAAQTEQRFPLGVARQLCESAFGDLPERERTRILATVPTGVRSMFTLDDPTETDVPELLGTTPHLLDLFGGNGPAVLLVDDVEWADTQSLHWLNHLGERVAGSAVVLVVSVRDGNPEADSRWVRGLVRAADSTVRVGRLSVAGVGAMVRQVCGARATNQFLDACLAVSGRHPLVLRSVLEEVAAGGHPPSDDAVDLVRSCRPAMLRDRCLARLRGQPSAVHAYLRAVRCLGDGAEPHLVARLAGLDRTEHRATERSLVEQGFVVKERPTTFVHPAVDDAVSELTDTAESQRSHLAAATLLYDAGHPAEDVAAHLVAVPSPLEPWAVDVLRDAAALGGVDAARYLRRALLDTDQDSARRGDLLLRLAGVERAVDQAASARHVLEAVSLARSAEERAAAVASLPPLWLSVATPSVAEMIREVAAELGDPAHAAEPERELALRLEARLRVIDHGDARKVRSAVGRLRDLDRDRHLATPAGRELVAVLLETAAVAGTVPHQELVGLAKRLLALESPTAYARTATPMAVTALALAGETDAVLPWLTSALDHARRLSGTAAEAAALSGHALVLANAGRLGEAISHVSESMRLIPLRWFETATAVAATSMATMLALHDHGPFRSVIDGDVGWADGPVRARITLVATAMRPGSGGDLSLVLARVLECGRQLDRAGWRNPALVPWRARAAWAYHRLGDREAALQMADTQYDLAVEWGTPTTIGHALRLRGALTEGAIGVHMLRDALEILESSTNRFEQAMAHRLLGDRLLRAGDGTGERHARCARDLLDGGVTRWLAEQEIGCWGANTVGPSGPRFGEVLTRAELRVVEFAVAGQTNKAIAGELGVSCRAVEKHLTRAYRKLDVSGRTGLKQAWRARGVPSEPLA